MSITGTRDLSWAIAAATPITGTQQLIWAVDAFRAAIGGSQNISWSLSQREQITVELDNAPTGLVGVLTVAITTQSDAIVVAPTTRGIVESPADSGHYIATIDRPPVGQYRVVWSDGSTSTFTDLEIIFFGAETTRLRVLRAPVQPLGDGDLMEFVVTIADHADQPADPEGLTLSVNPPTGTPFVFIFGVDPQIVKDSVGVYRAAVPIFGEDSSVPPGLVRRLGSWRWEATGDLQDAEEGTFIIRRSLLAA